MKFQIIETEVDVGVQDPFRTVAPTALQAFEANFGDYYISDSPKLRAILWEYKIEP
jgi:hypothetical protein